jgi:hypothetical protein
MLPRFAGLVLALPLLAGLAIATARADEFEFAPAPETDLNRIYRVNQFTGEMSACQYAIKDGTVGVTFCYPAGEGAGTQPPGDYHLVASNHAREAGIFRVNRRTGDISICYVLSERVVCTPQTR